MTDVNLTSVICVNHAFSHGSLISLLGRISIVSEGFYRGISLRLHLQNVYQVK